MNKFPTNLIVSLIDLTSLQHNETPDTIKQLCTKAVTPYGPAAAVCIYPAFVALAKSLLQDTPISVVTVANFPKGNQPLPDCLQEIKQAILEGANEIDVVMPYQHFLQNDRAFVITYLQACRKLCSNIILKVILETGALQHRELIYSAAQLAIESGADFIKSSTGKTAMGITLPALTAMVKAIKDFSQSNHSVGIKISGGIEGIEQVQKYLGFVASEMGEKFINAKIFRIGTSKLLENLLAVTN